MIWHRIVLSMSMQLLSSTNGLTLREYSSYYQENLDQNFGSRIVNPVSCGYPATQPAVETCSYGLVTIVGLIPIGTRVDLFTFSDKIFVVTYMFKCSDGMGANNINHMFDSFSLPGSIL